MRRCNRFRCAFSEKFQTSSHKIDIVFQIGTINAETKKISNQTKSDIVVISKSAPQNISGSLAGKKFTAEELKGFDVTKLIGANANINVVHNGDWANIASIMPLTQGQAKLLPDNYSRPNQTTVSQTAPQAEMTSANSEIPTSVSEDEVPFNR